MGHFLHHRREKSNGNLPAQNPEPCVTSLLYDSGGNRKYLTRDERREFLRAAASLPPEAQTFCLVLAYTGCRLSEALAICPRHVDFDARVIIIQSLKKRRRGVFRAVPIPQSLLSLLNRVHAVGRARQSRASIDGRIWSFGRTTAWSYVKTAMKACEFSGACASPKGLRHAFGVGALQAGAPINLVRKWLGHSRLSTTAIYADAVGDEERGFAANIWRHF